MGDSLARIREAWRARMAPGSVRIPAAATEIAATLRRDAAFCAAFLDDTLRQTVYEEGIDLVSRDRTVATRVATGAEVASLVADGIRGSPWERWLERDPATGAHVRLVDMTREQLLAAAGSREERAKTERRRADFDRALAARLRDGQRVRERWTTDEIDALYAALAAD